MNLQNKMEAILKDALSPSELIIINESQRHKGHVGISSNKDFSNETHFYIKVKSDKFKNLSLVSQHRMVYDLIGKEFENSLHALKLDTSF